MLHNTTTCLGFSNLVMLVKQQEVFSIPMYLSYGIVSTNKLRNRKTFKSTSENVHHGLDGALKWQCTDKDHTCADTGKLYTKVQFYCHK